MIFGRYFRLASLAMALVLIVPLLVAAVGFAQNDGGGAIAQGFRIDGAAEDFVTGALVSVKNDDSRTVRLSGTESVNRLVGVVGKEPLVALSGAENESEVIISGTTQVLVSDINGDIRAGDKITASPVAGIGMLATVSGQIIGTAQAALDVKTAASRTINDQKGKPRVVHIGLVPVQISVSHYQVPVNEFVPPFIQSLADTLAGRPVSLIRILMSGLLVLMAFVSAAILLYTSVRSGITSIGRNPMAATAIRRGLLQVGVAAVLVLALAMLGSYLILAT